MTTDQAKIVKFLGGKSVPQKASPDKGSNTTLDYSNIVFPNNILPTTAAFKNFPFDTDWNWLMVVIEKLESMPYMIIVEIIGQSCCVSQMINHNWPEDKGILAEFNLTNAKTKLEATYKAVLSACEILNDDNNETKK